LAPEKQTILPTDDIDQSCCLVSRGPAQSNRQAAPQVGSQAPLSACAAAASLRLSFRRRAARLGR